MTLNQYPSVPIGAFATPVFRSEEVVTGRTYRQFGVRLWGKGVYEREATDGANTQYKSLFRVEAGDFVFNKIWARNGSAGVVPPELAGCYGSGEFPTFEPDRDKIDPRWFHWVAQTSEFWEQCAEKSHGTSGKNRIKPQEILEIEIPLPPLAEQQRIVARIEALAGKIAAARRLREEAGKETAAIEASLKGQLFDSYHQNGWPMVTLGEISEIRSGVTLGRRDLNGLLVTLPYLRVANVQDGYLDLSTIKQVEIRQSEQQVWQLQQNDILLTEGGDWDKLGRGTVWQGEIPNCIHQNHIFRLRLNLQEYNPYYVMAFISSPIGKSYFREASKQTTNLATINRRQLAAFTLIKPPIEEQNRIVLLLEQLQNKVAMLRHSQETTQRELDALLPAILDRAFKGEL